MMARAPKQCRYLDEGHCAYYDEVLTDKETIKCYKGGWDCFEEEGPGCIFEADKWVTLLQFNEWRKAQDAQRLPETLEAASTCSIRSCPVCKDILVYEEGQPVITCRKCGALYEKIDDPLPKPGVRSTVKQDSDRNLGPSRPSGRQS